MDRIVVLSIIAVPLAMFNNIAIRRKKWQGWAGSVVGACLYTYVNWLTGAWGYVFLGVFFFVNAIIGLWQWRKDMKAITTAGLLTLLATPAFAGAPFSFPPLIGTNWTTIIVCVVAAVAAGVLIVVRPEGKK
jgi:nicotinamide riboside transporter PnuC